MMLLERFRVSVILMLSFELYDFFRSLILRIFKETFLLLLAVLVLSGCTSVQELTQDALQSFRKESTYGHQEPRPAHDIIDGNVTNMSPHMSTSSVQVYDMDSSAMYPNVQGGMQPNPLYPSGPYTSGPTVTGVPTNGSSVVVFPLEGPASLSPSPYINGEQPSYGSPLNTGQSTPVSASQIYQTQRANKYYPVTSMIEQAEHYYANDVDVIYFAHGSTKLSNKAKEIIAKVAFDARGGADVRVEGHASSRAGLSSPNSQQINNYEVSMKRAMNVTKALIKEGVPAGAIKTTAFGDSRPKSPTNDKDAEAASRRVEIYTTPKAY